MDDKIYIAITIQNMVQFYSMKNGIDALLREGYIVHIYVPLSDDSSGFGTMFDSTFNYLINLGYSPLRITDNTIEYKILLEPYPMHWFADLKYKYRLKYKYSLLTAKPNLVYKPENNICYDAILCYGMYEANFLKVFSNVELIGNLKYLNLKPLTKPSTNKPILLYLPTYGDVSSIRNITSQLEKLKQKYYIITKFHHGTSFLQEEKDETIPIRNISDQCYDHKTELAQLLSIVDVVLSDNSGAIFESLYAKKPVAIYCENINANKYGNFDTIQYQLVQNGYIPYTNILEKIDNILDQALSEQFVKKQLEIRNKLFYFPDDPLNDFLQIIKKYLNDILYSSYENYISENNSLLYTISSKNTELLDLKAKLSDLEYDVLNKNKTIDQQNSLINQLNKDIAFKDLTIQYYEHGKLYKLSKKIYKTYHKIKKRSK